jgi:solute:Na+ symporter, SSS family
MAADSMAGARQTPLFAAFPKIFMPFVVILPGIAAVALMQQHIGYDIPLKAGGGPDYDLVLTTLMAKLYPSGMLGIGLTALMASFMSGMAGNVTAFNTVFTYDIYQSYIRPKATTITISGWGALQPWWASVLSIGTAFLATQFNDMMDFLQLIFAFVNAPLFATFLLGMFWKRTTSHAAFTGLLSRHSAAALTWLLTVAEGKGGLLGVVHTFGSAMAQSYWIAIMSWTTCFVVTSCQPGDRTETGKRTQESGLRIYRCSAA